MGENQIAVSYNKTDFNLFDCEKQILCHKTPIQLGPENIRIIFPHIYRALIC